MSLLHNNTHPRAHVRRTEVTFTVDYCVDQQVSHALHAFVVVRVQCLLNQLDVLVP